VCRQPIWRSELVKKLPDSSPPSAVKELGNKYWVFLANMYLNRILLGNLILFSVAEVYKEKGYEDYCYCYYTPGRERIVPCNVM